MALIGNIKPLIDKDGNYVFPETSVDAVYFPDGTTISEKLDGTVFCSDDIDTIEIEKADGVKRLDSIENKLLNPEMFRIQNGIEVSDQIAINKAIEIALDTTKELHLYKNYTIDNIVINNNLRVYGHGNTLISSSNQEVFIEINSQCKVYLNQLRVYCPHANIGILNNDSELNLYNVFVSSAKEKNVLYKKVNTSGYGEINFLESQLSKVGLELNATDVKVNRYQGFNCITHISSNSGGNFISNSHGWCMKDSSMGDYVTGSTMIDVKSGSITLSNIYADTVENAIKLPNDNQYTLISITNLIYFLNRTYYPDGINRPNPIKNLSGFKGYLNLQNLQVDSGAWRDKSGNMVELIEGSIDYSKVNITGIANNGYLDNNYLMPVTSSDLYQYVTNVNNEYFSPYSQVFRVDKNNVDVKILASMNKPLPNNTIAYQCTFNKAPLTKLNSTSLYNAIVNEGGTFRDLHVQIVANTLTVTNKTGSTINEGVLVIRFHHIDF